ncbi:restriction endonuclease [Paenibacillus harenae]|uniref:restriction endonuclease n=1 Tax=Paenibacillus harenae TaxID=306543 RepID=UPI0004128C7B|nr:restriction endonuclease [Paenibacillus harenae]
MNTELTLLVNESLVAPIIFMLMCMLVYCFVGLLLYYFFLKWLPEVIVRLAGGIGLFYIIFLCSSRYKEIKSLVDRFSITQMFIGLALLFVIIAVISALVIPNKKSARSTKSNRRSKPKKSQPSSNQRYQDRSDNEILISPLTDLSGAEFERLLALYFRDNGYQVREVGIGGNDGGVDLVIIDQRGEKTAVQAKCYADHNTVGVSVVRELVGAKRNHDCILSLLITTSDLTASARKEAEKLRVDYWHGAIVEQKLKAWGKWQPGAKPVKHKSPTTNLANFEMQSAKAQTGAAKQIICSCGATMVLRKSKDGNTFYGCSSFPKCRQTKSI